MIVPMIDAKQWYHHDQILLFYQHNMHANIHEECTQYNQPYVCLMHVSEQIFDIDIQSHISTKCMQGHYIIT